MVDRFCCFGARAGRRRVGWNRGKGLGGMGGDSALGTTAPAGGLAPPQSPCLYGSRDHPGEIGILWRAKRPATRGRAGPGEGRPRGQGSSRDQGRSLGLSPPGS